MTAEWTKQYKHPITYLLLEDGAYLLQENNSKLVLEQTGETVSLWTDQVKN